MLQEQDDISKNENPGESFTKLSKNIVLCILSENLDKLSILKHINGWSEDEQTVVEYKTIEEQCQVPKNDVLPAKSKDTIDLTDFQKDCSFIESTIRKAYEEIRTKGTYQTISALIEIFKRLRSDELFLLEDTEKKELEYIRLQKVFCKEREVFQREIEDVATKIGKLKDEIEDFEQEAKIKSKYITNWENAKIETNRYVLTKKETEMRELIHEREHDFTKEDRVHQEIANIFNEIEMDFHEAIKKWKLKYEYDLKEIMKKINILQEKKDQQQEKTANMVKKYIKRQEEMDAYKEHLVELERRRKIKERKDKAATTIQAWWRGTMVRKGFGKFKKKKDKKGKKKSPLEKKK